MLSGAVAEYTASNDEEHSSASQQHPVTRWKEGDTFHLHVYAGHAGKKITLRKLLQTNIVFLKIPHVAFHGFASKLY